MNNVFWVDQWSMLEEIWRYTEGRYNVSYFFTPYWGHRIVIPRLLFLLDDKLFALATPPIAALTLTAWLFTLGVVITLQFHLLKNRPRPITILLASVTAYLMLSPLQMENFVYGMSIQYAIGFAGAVASFACIGLETRWGFWIGVLSALVSTLCMASGTLLWPVLVGQLIARGAPRRRVITMCCFFALVLVLYFSSYSQPGSGMGFQGIARRPLQAMMIAAMFLGGPVGLANASFGSAMGLIGLACVITFGVVALSGRTTGRIAASSLLALLVWLCSVSLSIPFARMTPEWIASYHGRAPLPGRYFTASFLFWCCLGTISLASLLASSKRRWLRTVPLLALGAVTLATALQEKTYLSNWLTFCERLDAVGAGLIVGASDPQYMDSSYPDETLLRRWVSYEHSKHLAIFSEPRSTWLNRQIETLFAPAPAPDCQVHMDSEVAVLGGRRITGTTSGSDAPLAARRQLLFTDSDGIVIGLGKTFYLESVQKGREAFLAYLTPSNQPVRGIYLVDANNKANRCSADRPEPRSAAIGLSLQIARQYKNPS